MEQEAANGIFARLFFEDLAPSIHLDSNDSRKVVSVVNREGRYMEVSYGDASPHLIASGTLTPLEYWTGLGEYFDIFTTSLSISPTRTTFFTATNLYFAGGLAANRRSSVIANWDLQNGKRTILEALNGRVVSAISANDGRHYVAAIEGFTQTRQPDSHVYVWNVDGGSRTELHGLRGTPRAVAVSADSQQIAAASEDGEVRLWSLKNAKHIRTFDTGLGAISVIQFCRDMRSLLIADHQGVASLWDSEGEPITSFVLPGAISSADVSQDGRLIAIGEATGKIVIRTLTDSNDVDGGLRPREVDTTAIPNLKSRSFETVPSKKELRAMVDSFNWSASAVSQNRDYYLQLGIEHLKDGNIGACTTSLHKAALAIALRDNEHPSPEKLRELRQRGFEIHWDAVSSLKESKDDPLNEFTKVNGLAAEFQPGRLPSAIRVLSLRMRAERLFQLERFTESLSDIEEAQSLIANIEKPDDLILQEKKTLSALAIDGLKKVEATLDGLNLLR